MPKNTPKTGLRGEMRRRAARALAATWDAIGYDTMQTYVDCGEAENINDVVLTRDEVIDMVTACGYKGGYPMSHGNDKLAIEWLDGQTEEVKQEILMEAFPHARYGM